MPRKWFWRNLRVLLAAGFAAAAPSLALGVEEAEYRVLQQDGAIELREYAPSIVAETIVDADFMGIAIVSFGLAVDDTIHFFVRLRDAVAHEGEGTALRTALGAVIRPVTLTTAALALGFVALVAGDLRSQVDFGLLAAATLVIAWVIDLTVTPALAHAAGMARRPR